jgi:hypothetical protein
MNSLCGWLIYAHLSVERQQRLLHEATRMTCLSAHDGQGGSAVRARHWRQWLSWLSARIAAAVRWSPRTPPGGPASGGEPCGGRVGDTGCA